jgi:excinuclease UvrABC ATPase subunit
MHPLIALTIVAVVVYMASCYFHPYQRCKTCNRSKELHSTTFKGAFGKCRACKGVGHSVRLGAKILNRK